MRLLSNGFQVFPAIRNIVERCGIQWTGVETEFRFKFIHSSRFKAKNSEKRDYSAKNLKSRQSEKFCEKICNLERNPERKKRLERKRREIGFEKKQNIGTHFQVTGTMLLG